MKKHVLISGVICLLVSAVPQYSHACNECHSKNPKMVKMHEALGFKDCFNCHGPLGKVKKGDEQKIQMKTDPLCSGCHKDSP